MVIWALITVGSIIFVVYMLYSMAVNVKNSITKSICIRKQSLDDFIDELAEICQIDTSISGRSGVFKAADELCTSKWCQYRAEHKISGEILDSKSSLGMCTSSPDRFYYRLDTNFIGTSSICAEKYAAISSYSGELSNYSNSELSAYSDKIQSLTHQVAEYIRVLRANKFPFAKSIPLKDIKMYRIEGNVHYTSDVSGGGANLGGAVAGGLLFGGAGAVVGSKVGTNIQTETVKTDDRKLVLYYLENNALKVEKIDCNGDIDDTLEVLRKLMPQKDEAMLQLQSWSNALQ